LDGLFARSKRSTKKHEPEGFVRAISVTSWIVLSLAKRARTLFRIDKLLMEEVMIEANQN